MMRVSLPTLLLVMLQGCVAVPQNVPADVLQTTDIEIAPETVVSVGPRRYIDDVREKILKQDKTIRISDSLAFRDLAFPEGGWALSHLLDPGVSAAVSEQADVRYLVLLGPAVLYQESDEKGGYVPMLVGAQSSKITTTLTAAIIDLPAAKLVKFVRSEAEGTFRSVTWIIYMAMKVPRTQAAAFNAFGKAIVDEVGPGASLVILAAEGVEEPFTLTADISQPSLD